MRVVTLVNRTSLNLKGTANGVHYTIPPGKSAYAEPLALMFKAQNPIMGSENFYIPDERDYLLGIEEDGDDCSPCEQTNSIERFNRKQITLDITKDEVKVVSGKGGLYSRKSADFAPVPQRADGFVAAKE